VNNRGWQLSAGGRSRSGARLAPWANQEPEAEQADPDKDEGGEEDKQSLNSHNLASTEQPSGQSEGAKNHQDAETKNCKLFPHTHGGRESSGIIALTPPAGNAVRLKGMTRTECGLVLLAAFAGGAAGSRWLASPAVQAQGGARFKVVEAEEVRLVEPDGRPAARLQIDQHGRPGLFLYDKHGEVRAVLGVLPSGSPHLALSDRRGQVRAAVAVLSDQTVAMVLSDGDGRQRVDLRAPADDNPRLVLSDRGGRPVWSAPGDP
jgi:hypothetical protein